jgi:hypothetical protein
VKGGRSTDPDMDFSGTKSMRRSRQAGEGRDLPGEGFLASSLSFLLRAVLTRTRLGTLGILRVVI